MFGTKVWFRKMKLVLALLVIGILIAGFGCSMQERVDMAQGVTETAINTLADRVEALVARPLPPTEAQITSGTLATAGIANLLLAALYLARKKWIPMGKR